MIFIGLCDHLHTIFVPLPRCRHPFPRVFNSCNQKELESYLSSGGGMCLFNLPNTRVMYGGQRCGNGYLEEGEECDCGDEKVSVVTFLWIVFILDAFARTHDSFFFLCRSAPAPAVMPTTAL